MLSTNMAELDTVSPVVWPKWCYTNRHPESEPVHPSICKVPGTVKTRRKKTKSVVGGVVKNERCSPDPETLGTGTESSERSDSPPHSPGSSSLRTRTPHSLAGTPPAHPALTSLERFSPATSARSAASAMEGLHMSRNYSDFMRSLAAKYNNSNPNEYRANGYVAPAVMDRFAAFTTAASTGAAAGYPLLLNPLPKKGADDSTKSKEKRAEDVLASASALQLTHPLSLPNLMAGMNSGTMSQLPMIDMSSTQALLNIVRSASAQNAQQLETYLRSSSSSATAATSATKRPADPHAPHDLSAHVAKRPYIDPLAPFKAVEMEALLPAGGKKSPTRPPTGGSANKTLPMSCRLTCAADSCSPAATQVQLWTVTDVVNFVKTIDLCQEYAEVFREHSIDGCTLPLLTEEHLMSTMSMKLGPALKLRSVLAKKIGHCAVCLHCVHCHSASDPSTSPPRDHSNDD